MVEMFRFCILEFLALFPARLSESERDSRECVGSRISRSVEQIRYSDNRGENQLGGYDRLAFHVSRRLDDLTDRTVLTRKDYKI